MSEMIERAALALHAHLRLDPTEYVGEYRKYGRETEISGVFDLNDIVRVVIEVMREPTENMWEAGLATGHVGGIGDNGGLEPNDFDPEEVWPAMIDAALADTKATKAA